MPRIKDEIYIVSPLRTAIGKFGGSLSTETAVQLGSFIAREVVKRSGVDRESVDEVVFGHGRQAGGGPNSARQICTVALLLLSV